MPNWTQNHVIMKGDKQTLDEIKNLMQGSTTCFDFGKIVPMPDSLNIISGGIMDTAIKVAQSRPGSKERTQLMKDIRLPYELTVGYAGYGPKILNTEQDVADFGQIYIDNKKKYGHETWYEWACENWGTKWNTHDPYCSQENDGTLVYEFDTAWAEPTPVFEALSKKYPSVTIVNHANYEDDPDWKSYVTEFKNGQITDHHEEIDENMRSEDEDD